VIDVELEFDGRALDRIVAAFLSLPPDLRPQSYSAGETDPGSSIDDQKKFSAFVSKSKSGFFLKRAGLVCSVRIAGDKSIVCDCFVEQGADAARRLLTHLAKARPLFGYAADPAERERRNRVAVEQGQNKIEAWVGRDTTRYVPGLYWLTLLPRGLAESHKLPIDELKQRAMEHTRLDDDLDLFRFYKNPEDWNAAKDKIDDLYRMAPGVFDIEKVRPSLPAASSFLELNALLQKWK
jgi:hypothetical protein